MNISQQLLTGAGAASAVPERRGYDRGIVQSNEDDHETEVEPGEAKSEGSGGRPA